MKPQHLPAMTQRRLIRRARQGDTASRDLLITSNRNLIAKVANEFRNRGAEFDDLMQEGALGLMHAIDKFDLDRPVALSTYGQWWIRQAMGRHCERQGTTSKRGVRLPSHIDNAISRIARERHELERKLGREATEEELALCCDISVDSAVQAVRIMHQETPLPIDQARHSDGRALDEVLPDASIDVSAEVEESDMRQRLRGMIDRLPDAEKALLDHRYGLDGGTAAPEAELASRWGVDVSELRATRARALRKLRRDPELPALHHGLSPLPDDLQQSVSRGVLERCGDQLRLGSDPRAVDGLNVKSEMSDNAITGTVSSDGIWFLFIRACAASPWDVRVTDASGERLMTLREAGLRLRGPSLVDVAAWARDLPLSESNGVHAR